MAGWVVWLIIAGCLFIAEMLTLTFYLLWLGVGALFGAVAAFAAPESLFVQVIAASIVSLLLVLGSKRISQHFRMGKGYKDAVDALVGKTAVVTQDITDQANGIVKIGGDVWSATADEHIRHGEKVRVVERRSTVLYVRRERDSSWLE
ncbi:NfeD family protein [Ectobacillus funiculus]|uniref:NfeD family protein n=1 Tax=Ectobacillus funiculus TaxID=137993 RepID=UPI00397D7D44